MNSFSEIKRLLSNYDSLDSLAAVAGLQLLPENSGRFVRLEALSCILASLPPASSKPLISQGRLKTILNEGFLAGIEVTSYEDPQEYAFTETFGFDGGPFIVFPGPSDDTTFILQHLLKAVFKHPTPVGTPTWLIEMHQLSMAVFVLSEEVSRRAGLGRAVEPEYRPGSPVIIPSKIKLEALKKGVTFTKNELALLLSKADLPLQALEPLIIKPGQASMSEYHPVTGELYARPIIQNENIYVIALPHRLLNALRHALLNSAQKEDVTHEIVKRYSEAVWVNVIDSLEYLEIEQESDLSAIVHPEGCLIEAAFRFDVDKVLQVIQVTDSLINYNPNDAFGDWHTNRLSQAIEDRIQFLTTELMNSAEPPNEMMFFLIVQGVGRAYGIRMPDFAGANALYLSAADLRTIAHLEAGNSLLLWKYKRATSKLRRSAFFHKPDELAQFYLYRKNRYNYYLSDTERPNLIALMPGYAQELREEESRSRDRHVVPSYQGSALNEVALLFSDRAIPIYFSLDSIYSGATELLIKELPFPVWVVNAPYSTEEQRSNRKLYVQLTETIAYWLWQLTPSLQMVLTSFKPLPRRVLIQIELLNPDFWNSPITIPPNDPPVKVIREDESAIFKIILSPSIHSLFNTSDNRAEREIIRHLLEALCVLLPLDRKYLLDHIAIDRILELHAPLGKKKKLVLFEASHFNEIQREDLPSYRKVQDADLSDLLDELGHQLIKVERMSIGSIPDEKRLPICNKAVSFFYKELQGLVATLNPEGLLEWLVSYQEAVTAESAFHQMILPTRLACFGPESDLVKQLQKETSEFSTSQVTCRFIIEYVVANPPLGLRPISLSVYDRLQALALHIINFGSDSDTIHFGLADHKMAILKSGRLGFDRDSFKSAQKDWLPVWTQGNISRANRYFASLWRDKSVESSEQQELIQRLDIAALEEFGFTLSEQLEFAIAAAKLGKSLNSVVAKLAYKNFIQQLSEKLNWASEKVGKALDMLSLSPRSDFLRPPSPYRPEDVYPWRFNRALSYLRRPFLIRLKQNGDLGTAEVVWGIRHLGSFWRNLSDLCLGGRLKAKTPNMVKLLGELNNNRGKRFNTRVAEVFKSLPSIIVKEQVKKIGSLRLSGEKGDLGDIDVLVADKKKSCLYLIECKDLAQARTPYEMSGEIENLFRGRKGHKSIIELHQQRVQWAQEHLAEILTWLGINTTKRWKIEPLIVVDSVLFTPYLYSSPLPIIPLDQLVREITVLQRS